LQLVTGASLYDNRYPLESIESAEPRNDHALAGWVGAAYFFSPLTYFRADYRYERRRSNLDQFQYTSNVLRIIVGVGIFSR
jgi:predicted porin